MPTSSSEKEGSTGRVPADEEQEIQSARPANQNPSPELVQEESERRDSPEPNPKNAPTSKALAEKAASKKRSATTGEAPPPKKSKGFTAKKKKPSRPPPKVVINIPAEDTSPATEERGLIPYAAAADQTLEQPEALA
ncbi:uncharacterized protein LOC104893713 [Beta vulgaris subsp. vulgaris]|uniref:uncharacterized protein LOC104893713 n=1 Tax=Beta vulgaris subsp. vulgaris TaxID=3555 RepID=UPI00053F53E3|nr:uncharacterized protein LOC104893713 [Beta vulgaris subsp. vulgaris]